MNEIKLRYNTKAQSDDPRWRVVIDGVEYPATDVRINVPSWTTTDILPDVGQKWHVTTRGSITWDGTVCTISEPNCACGVC
jgi:hypothetical protein